MRIIFVQLLVFSFKFLVFQFVLFFLWQYLKFSPKEVSASYTVLFYSLVLIDNLKPPWYIPLVFLD